jgi:predicted acyl esterase
VATKGAARRGGLSQPRHDIVIEKDVEVAMRDGARLRADVFRPKSNARFPVIINLGAYMKDKVWVPPPDLEEAPNPHMNWETVNPLWWVPRGYVAVRVDTRGSGKSPGRTDPWSPAESSDFHDAIEWAARQPWCNGRVGTSGVSYFAMTQWLVAGLKPPSLKAMIPWEGAADMYRDLGYHGGIFSFGFVVNWYNNHMAHHLLGKPQASAPDAFSAPTGSGSTRPFSVPATGVAWACTCAAIPKRSFARAPRTSACASTRARTTTRSMPRRPGRSSCASSITGSRVSIRGSSTSRR